MEDRRKVEMIKNKYPIGTRIKLNYMNDDLKNSKERKKYG